MNNDNMKLLKKFLIERNASERTGVGYEHTIRQFTETIGISLDKLIEIAKKEKNKDWEEQQLRQWLIIYRNYCYGTYKESTASLYLRRVKAIFHHYGIRTDSLPYFSTKQVRKSEEIDYEDLPNREILKKCIEINNPLLKAMTLFMSSTGMSKKDTWELTIGDYLNATFEYHESDDIHTAIRAMDKSEISIIPTFKLNRRKTGETYRTFASPEAVSAVNIYLLSREDDMNSNSRLFDVSLRYVNDLFSRANTKLKLGTVNGYGRFTPQMLRSYHASQLAEAGMTDSHIDLLQGRKPSSIARKHYIRVKRETLKKEYIRCLPFLVVEDIEEVRTELEVTRDKLNEKEAEVLEMDKRLSSIEEKLLELENRPSDRTAILERVGKKLQ